MEGSKIQESEVKERILSESTAERSTIEKSESMNDSTKKEVPLNKLNIP